MVNMISAASTMASKSNIEITVCSDLDYENLVAEITIDGKFIGLVTNEPDKGICFEIPNGQISFQSIDLDALEQALKNAKKELLTP